MFATSDSRDRTGAASAGRGLVRLVLTGGAAALVAGSALAATKGTPVKAPPKQRFSFDTPVASFQPPVGDLNKFSFTAAGNAAASARMQTQERAFRFTPSGQADNRKALSLGVSTRVVAAAADRSRAAPPLEATAALPTAYGVEASVGWKGFAVNTGYRHVEPGPAALLATRTDAVDIALSYGGSNWKTRLLGTAEQHVGDLGSVLLAPIERRYSFEFGGAYAVAPRLSVSGGVRYKIAPAVPTILDSARSDQSVYLGTNFAF